MSAVTVQNLAYGDLLVRMIYRGSEPWFVASDICAALEIQNTASAVKMLDEEDKHRLNLCSGGRDAIIVSEAGLYTLLLRARDATTADTPAWRFRRWVTREVLPTIRRTGRYVMPEQEVEEQAEADETSVTELDLALKLSLVREARRTFGREAARRAWVAAGLPRVASGPELAVVAYGEARHPQVEMWLNRRTIAAPNEWIESSVLYRDYVEWCRAEGQVIVSVTAFGSDLRRMGHEPFKSGTVRRRGLRLVAEPIGVTVLQ